MNVLSLFDGMSCGQIALERAGIKVDNYYASEIDKHAIKVTMANYPKTIQLGDVLNIKAADLPKIDLLIGGSPCQGFSIAGKKLNFDDPRSKLFFEYARLHKELRPKYFLLENVKMKLEHQNIISDILGVMPVKINSSMLSAQSRERLYWTNMPHTKPTTDLGWLIKDVIDSVCNDESMFIREDKAKFVKLDSHYSRVGLKCIGGMVSDKVKLWDTANKKILQRNFGQGSRVYSIEGKGCTLNALGGGWGAKTGLYKTVNGIRKLTVNECERMQTIPAGYCSGITYNQAVRMIGNGWTIDVIVNFFKGLK